jgi:hypothetical protein
MGLTHPRGLPISRAMLAGKKDGPVATLKIEPLSVESRGKHRVIITGISPTDHDCLVGQYWIGNDGPHSARWDLSGYMRGGSDARNLDMRDDSLAELTNLVIQLGGKR